MKMSSRTMRRVILGALTVAVVLGIAFFIRQLGPQERWAALSAVVVFAVVSAVCVVVWHRFRR